MVGSVEGDICSGCCSDDEATRNGHRPDRTAHQTRKILPSTRGQREQNRRGHGVKLLTEAVILTPLDQDYDSGRRDPASRRP
jgi:hypothetical protein